MMLSLLLVACARGPGEAPAQTPTASLGSAAPTVSRPEPTGGLPVPTVDRPAATAVGGAASTSPTTANKWGVHLLLDDGVSQWPGAVWDEHLAYARWVVGSGGYVLELVRADDLDLARWQPFFDRVAQLGLTPILRLATWQDRAAGHWVAPPRDPSERSYRQIAERYARFLAGLRYAAPLYVTVGNEPNRGDEWGGKPDPAEYSRFLMDVSAALHRTAPGRVLVLNAGLDLYAPDSHGREVNGFRAIDAGSFLDGMQASEPKVWDAIDVWASHDYPLGPFAAPPSARAYQVDDLLLGGPRTQTAPWPGLFNRGVNAYQWELYKLRSFGVRRDLQVIITETGWRHSDTQQPSSDAAGAGIPAEQAARFLQLAFDGDSRLEPQEYTWSPWSSDPSVKAAVIFALDGEPSRWGHTNLVDLAPDGRVIGLKPQFASLPRP
jgi:hypothetical protein